MCAITRASAPVFHCTHSCTRVFINTANGLSAGATFVCSVTQPGSRFIRRVFRAEPWARAVNDLTPASGRRGQTGERGGSWAESMIDLALRHGDILTLGAGKGNGWNASLQETEKGKWMETSVMTALTPRAETWCESQRRAFGGGQRLEGDHTAGVTSWLWSGLRDFGCGICTVSQLDSLGIPASSHRPKTWTLGWLKILTWFSMCPVKDTSEAYSCLGQFRVFTGRLE